MFSTIFRWWECSEKRVKIEGFLFNREGVLEGTVERFSNEGKEGSRVRNKITEPHGGSMSKSDVQ